MKILGIIERKKSNGMRNCMKNNRYPSRNDDGKTIIITTITWPKMYFRIKSVIHIIDLHNEILE
jgi:hypothetical protein